MTIIEQLKEQLTQLNNGIALATMERDRVAAAVAALEGKEPPHPTTSAVPLKPVAELILESAMSMPVGYTFDHRSIRDKAQRDFPSQAVRIKTGVYNSIATLLKKEKIVRAPGGYQVKR